MQGNFDLSCFQASYQSARQRFLDELAQVPAGLVKEHTACANPVPGPDGQEVYLDWLYLGQHDVPSNLLVLISGTHGVEGFAGSAVQSCWLSFLARQVSEDSSLGVVILHALNPWGFAWLRRYDHQGIDLNRNFIDFTLPLPVNEQYDLVHGDLFSDTSKPVEETIGHWQDQWGQRQFSSVVTRGQYRHDDGLFYGGSSPSWSRQTLEQLCDSSPLGGARRIAVIDLHTGLGPYGYGEV
ncbi:DUF2817 domain-containing protein, partial [Kaarinaea lacus]